jgi:hypothetical protein
VDLQFLFVNGTVTCLKPASRQQMQAWDKKHSAPVQISTAATLLTCTLHLSFIHGLGGNPARAR